MDLEELGGILKEMYLNAPQKEQVAYIHLFGIKYAEIIRKNNFKISSIIKSSGIQKSYAVEVSKGVKLAKFVCLK